MFSNRRVEEDLERIRKANLPPEKLEAEEAKEQAVRDAISTGEIRITFKDIFAMTIAVFSLILPYLLVTAAVIGLLFLWIFR